MSNRRTWDLEEAKRLRAEGWSYNRIGKLLGVDMGTIWKGLHPDRAREHNKRAYERHKERKRLFPVPPEPDFVIISKPCEVDMGGGPCGNIPTMFKRKKTGGRYYYCRTHWNYKLVGEYDWIPPQNDESPTSPQGL